MDSLNDVPAVIAQVAGSIAIIAGILAVFWRFILREPIHMIRAQMQRFNTLEEGQAKDRLQAAETQATNTETFKQLRIAVDEGNTEAIQRLDHINGTVGELKRSDIQQNIEIAVLKAEKRIWEGISVASRQPPQQREGETQ